MADELESERVMGDSDTRGSNEELPHGEAVEDFVEQVRRSDLDDAIDRLILFGSVARSAHGIESDIDVLAIVDTDVDVHQVEESLRDIAYDTMLDHGVVVSIHAVSRSTFERRSNHPFFETVASEGHAIYG